MKLYLALSGQIKLYSHIWIILKYQFISGFICPDKTLFPYLDLPFITLRLSALALGARERKGKLTNEE